MWLHLLVHCYSISATTSVFHFPEQCGDRSVYLFHHDRTLMAGPLIWYYLIAEYMFIWVVTGQGPHRGHWALCCLWVRVMFITSIHANLYIRPCIFVCISLARRFNVPRGLHIRLGIEIMVWNGRHHLIVCRSCGKWHAVCGIRLLQCVLCWFFFFLIFFFFFEHVVLRSCTANCGTSSIFCPGCFFRRFHN